MIQTVTQKRISREFLPIIIKLNPKDKQIIIDWIDLFIIFVKNTEASKKTHYHELNKFIDPIFDEIYKMLKTVGFKNGEPEYNKQYPKIEFVWTIYCIISNIIYYIDFDVHVALHHASANDRKTGLINTLTYIKELLNK